MKKFTIATFVSALILSSAAGASAIEAPKTAPNGAMQLTPCQIAEYMRCLKGGDHNFCLDMAQTFDCVD